jgi:hypothetical protein
MKSARPANAFTLARASAAAPSASDAWSCSAPQHAWPGTSSTRNPLASSVRLVASFTWRNTVSMMQPRKSATVGRRSGAADGSRGAGGSARATAVRSSGSVDASMPIMNPTRDGPANSPAIPTLRTKLPAPKATRHSAGSCIRARNARTMAGMPRALASSARAAESPWP